MKTKSDYTAEAYALLQAKRTQDPTVFECPLGVFICRWSDHGWSAEWVPHWNEWIRLDRIKDPVIRSELRSPKESWTTVSETEHGA